MRDVPEGQGLQEYFPKSLVALGSRLAMPAPAQTNATSASHHNELLPAYPETPGNDHRSLHTITPSDPNGETSVVVHTNTAHLPGPAGSSRASRGGPTARTSVRPPKTVRENVVADYPDPACC